MRMRANTVSCTSGGGAGGGQYLNTSTKPVRTAPPPPLPSVAVINTNKRTFAQLHSEYGVPILRDKEQYRAMKGKCSSVPGWPIDNIEKQEQAADCVTVNPVVEPGDCNSTENVVMDLVDI